MNAHTALRSATNIRRIIGENMEYERYSNGSRRFVYHWCRNHFIASIEILPVGRRRYAIIRNGKADVPVFVEGGRELLSALSDFRHSAAIALDDLRVWQREAV
jgi:hypothetical protein